jgi:predicted transcriptional regulator
MQGIKVLVFSMILLLLIASPAGAKTYEAAGGYENPPPEGAEMAEPVEVEFWELPVWLILMQIACMPLELLASLKIWGYLGYCRVKREDLLDNALRDRIFSCIRDHPGIHLHAIARETGIRLGTLRYHLSVLQRSHMIVFVESEGMTCFFKNDGTYSGLQQRLLVHLHREVPHEILRLLLSRPSQTRNELAGSLGVAGPTVTWHMKRLMRDRLVSSEKDGRCVRYRIPCEIAPEVGKWLS